MGRNHGPPRWGTVPAHHPLASRLLRAIPRRPRRAALREMAQAAAAAPVDLASAGNMLQDLVHQRRTLSVYHTRPEAAALMARLAIGAQDIDWSRPGAVCEYRIADCSCGAGELLAAAYRRVRELHQRAGGSPGEVHAAVIEHGITAVDILPASVALAAARLDALEPDPAGHGGATRAVALRYVPINGRPPLDPDAPEGQPPHGSRQPGHPRLHELHQAGPPAHRPGRGRPEETEVRQAVPGPCDHEPALQRQAGPPGHGPERPQPGTAYPAHQPAGNRVHVGADAQDSGDHRGQGRQRALPLLRHLAHKMVRRGGTIALLLPMSALTAGGGSGETFGSRRPDQGWPAFRRKLTAKYTDIRIIGVAAFEEQDSSFSHDTHIAEVMLIARRTRTGEKPSKAGCFINLKRRPKDAERAAPLADAIEETGRELEEEPPGTVRELTVDGRSEGTIVRDLLPKDDIWTLSRVLDPGLMQAAADLKKGKLWPGDGGEQTKLPMAALGDIAKIGPYGSETDQLLSPVDGGGRAFPVIRGHDCDAQRTIEGQPTDELFLRPGLESRSRRLTGTTSRLHLNDNFRYNSQSTAALMTPEPSVGGRSWPNVRLEDERKEKALALWLNTSLGLITHWAMSNHSQNGLGYVSQKQARNMPVLNVHRLTRAQLDRMAEVFDQAKDLPLLPANEAWRDRVRIELDRRALEDALELGEGATAAVRELCCRWCLEPTVQGRKGRVIKRQPDMEQLAELAGARHRTRRGSEEARTAGAGNPAEESQTTAGGS